MLPFFTLLAAILILTLWGAGITPMALLMVTAFLCLGAAAALALRPAESKTGIPGSVIAALAAIVFIAATAVPLPSRLDAVGGSRRAAQNELARQTLAQARSLDVTQSSPTRFSITRNRSGTLRILILAVAMLAAAVLGASLSSLHRSRFLQVLMAFMLLFAAAGFLHQWVFPKARTLWWFIHTNHGSPVACFMSRTHYAGFIALLCPPALVFCLSRLRQRQWIPAGLYATAFTTMAFSVAMSLSRGAVLAMGLALFIILLASLRGLTLRHTFLTILCVAILFTGLYLGSSRLTPHAVQTEVTQRMGTLKEPLETTSAQLRISLWLDSVKVWQAYPFLGAGADGFQMVYPQVRSRTDRLAFDHTENEYLRLLVDGGLVGLILAAWLFCSAFRQWRRNHRSGALSSEVTMSVAGLAIVVAAHNAIDFPLYVPLYAIVCSAILGMVAAPHSETSTRHQLRSKTAAALFAGLALTIILFTSVHGIRPFQLDDPDVLDALDADGRAHALVSAPTAWHAWSGLGLKAFSVKTPETMALGEACVVQATQYDPNNYLLWETLGYTRIIMWDHQGADEAFHRMKKLRPWKKAPDYGTIRY